MNYNFHEGKEIARSMLEMYLQGRGINTAKPFSCLVPEHEDRHASMALKPNKRQVHCFSCGKSYDIFDLVGFETGLEKYDLFKNVFETYNIPVKGYTVELEKEKCKKENHCFWLTYREAALIGIHLPSYQMICRKRIDGELVMEKGEPVYEAVGKEQLDFSSSDRNPSIGFSGTFIASKQIPDENGEIQTVPCQAGDFLPERADVHLTPFAMVKIKKEDGHYRVGKDGFPLVEGVSWKDFLSEEMFQEMVFAKLRERIETLEEEKQKAKISFFRSEIKRIQEENGLNANYSEIYLNLWNEISLMEHGNDSLLRELYSLREILMERVSLVKLKKQRANKTA